MFELHPFFAPGVVAPSRHAPFKAACVAALLALSVASAQADTAVITVNQAVSADVLGSAANSFGSLSLGAFAHVTAIGWDVALTANSGSWLSDMYLSLQDSSGASGVYLAPGYGDDFAGSASYSSGGLVDLTSSGDDFFVGANGLLNYQYFELLSDLPGTDGIWTSGTVTLAYTVSAVPEPMTAALLPIGLLLLLAAKRRRGAAPS